MFQNLEKELRACCQVARLVESVCGHLDCSRAIIDDVLIIEDICNYKKEGVDFGQICLPKNNQQIAAVQRVIHIVRNAISAIGHEVLVSHNDINIIEDRVTQLLR